MAMPTGLTFDAALKTYVQSGFPLIGVNTRETDRATEHLRGLTAQLTKELETAKLPAERANLRNYGYKFMIWDSNNGWRIREDEGPNGQSAKAPENALTWFCTQDSATAGVYVMQNVNLFFRETVKWPTRLQYFRDAYAVGRRDNKHIILLGDMTELPPELAPYVVVLDYTLPTVEQLEDFIKDYTEALSLSFKKAEIHDAALAGRGMTLLEMESALCVSIVGSRGKKIDTNIIFLEKAKAVKKSGLLEYMPTNLDMIKDVGDLDNLKEYTERVAKAFHNREAAEKYGLPIPRGCLVAGIQGTGKSLFAKCVANLFNVPLFRLDIGKLFAGIVGATESRTRDVINLCDAMAPCVVFIDEIEKALAGLGSSDRSDSGVTARLIGSFLTWMAEKTSMVYVVATANNVDALPPEMLRKGRFDEMWFVDIPSVQSRQRIFEIHLTKRGRDVKKFKTGELAKAAEDFTGAEIENVIEQAMFVGFNEEREFTQADIIKAIANTYPIVKTKPAEVGGLREWAKNKARPANRFDASGRDQTKSGKPTTGKKTAGVWLKA